MDTLGIWYEPIKGDVKSKVDAKSEEQKEPCKISDVTTEIHVNLWKLRVNHDKATQGKSTLSKYERNFDYFLDLGLMISNISGIGKVGLYFPFVISSDEIMDLGIAFHQDANLVNTIFNADLRTTFTGAKILEVENQADNNKKFNIYSLDTKQQIEIEEYKNIGAVIHIKLDQISRGRAEAHYFRIRIKSDKVRNFSRIHNPKNSFFESAFLNTEVIDFRINERRNFDRSILERIDSCVLPKISKINFFLLRSEKDDYILSHKPSDNCRGLEKELWKTYLGDIYTHDDILAYHWKEKNIDSFRLLIKMKFEKNNVETIAKYIIVIAALSILFNLIASGLYDGMKSIGTYCKKNDATSPTTKDGTSNDCHNCHKN